MSEVVERSTEEDLEFLQVRKQVVAMFDIIKSYHANDCGRDKPFFKDLKTIKVTLSLEPAASLRMPRFMALMEFDRDSQGLHGSDFWAKVWAKPLMDVHGLDKEDGVGKLQSKAISEKIVSLTLCKDECASNLRDLFAESLISDELDLCKAVRDDVKLVQLVLFLDFESSLLDRLTKQNV